MQLILWKSLEAIFSWFSLSLATALITLATFSMLTILATPSHWPLWPPGLPWPCHVCQLGYPGRPRDLGLFGYLDHLGHLGNLFLLCYRFPGLPGHPGNEAHVADHAFFPHFFPSRLTDLHVLLEVWILIPLGVLQEIHHLLHWENTDSERNKEKESLTMSLNKASIESTVGVIYCSFKWYWIVIRAQCPEEKRQRNPGLFRVHALSTSCLLHHHLLSPLLMFLPLFYIASYLELAMIYVKSSINHQISHDVWEKPPGGVIMSTCRCTWYLDINLLNRRKLSAALPFSIASQSYDTSSPLSSISFYKLLSL